jgi:hypothetical protein
MRLKPRRNSQELSLSLEVELLPPAADASAEDEDSESNQSREPFPPLNMRKKRGVIIKYNFAVAL